MFSCWDFELILWMRSGVLRAAQVHYEGVDGHDGLDASIDRIVHFRLEGIAIG